MVWAVLVHSLKIGAGVVGKSKTVLRALEGILNELDRQEKNGHVFELS